MSKFLKFIVNLFLALAIIVTAGIIVPPLLGVNTTIVDTAGMDTNLALGSVTYSRDKAVLNLEQGDEILKESGSSTYAYIIQEGDTTSGEFKVVSATEPDASPETIILRNTVSEVVLTVPYIGFVVVAMQSLEGRIIIALVILFIIILFILSELWKKKDDEEDDEEETTDDNKEVFQEPAPRKAETAVNSFRENDRRPIEAAMAELSGAGAEEDMSEEEFAEQSNPEKKTAAPEHEEIIPGSTWNEEAVSSQVDPMPVFDSAKADEEPLNDTKSGPTEEVTGDTKVFPSALSPMLNNLDGAGANSDIGATKVIPDLGSYPKTEETVLPKKEEKTAVEEPKPLWSWEDETFENETEGFYGTSAGHPASADEFPERFAPVERMSRQEIIDQAKSGGSEPKIRRDDVTGIDIIDYSEFL